MQTARERQRQHQIGGSHRSTLVKRTPRDSGSEQGKTPILSWRESEILPTVKACQPKPKPREKLKVKAEFHSQKVCESKKGNTSEDKYQAAALQGWRLFKPSEKSSRLPKQTLGT